MQVWHSPGNTMDFSPFQLFQTFSGLHDDAVWIDWSYDSRYLLIVLENSCVFLKIHLFVGR